MKKQRTGWDKVHIHSIFQVVSTLLISPHFFCDQDSEKGHRFRIEWWFRLKQCDVCDMVSLYGQGLVIQCKLKLMGFSSDSRWACPQFPASVDHAQKYYTWQTLSSHVTIPRAWTPLWVRDITTKDIRTAFLCEWCETNQALSAFLDSTGVMSHLSPMSTLKILLLREGTSLILWWSCNRVLLGSSSINTALSLRQGVWYIKESIVALHRSLKYA